MKNTVKLIGVIALAAVIALAFTACSGSGGGGISLNSAEALKAYLDKQPANSLDKPIKVAMKANEMMIEGIVEVLNNAGKYVNLDLSDSPLTTIPSGAFKDCKTLTGITIPTSVTSIGAYAFSGSGLTGITIPTSVTEIGGGVFSNCENLTVANITIPDRLIPQYEVVNVPGGNFQMGTASGGFGAERPVHTVTLSAFSIGKYEVTQKLYQWIMGNNPGDFKGNNLPVEQVSWYDAVAFANELSFWHGLQPVYTINGEVVTADWSKNGYRLPTEAQWEYAAKGGNGSPGNFIYAGSNTVGDVAWYGANSGYSTHEVGTKAPNGLEIYDMSGNVGEWCWDWYGSYTSDNDGVDPVGAVSGTIRVLRGGGWNNSATYVRSAHQYASYPNARGNPFGFRLVRPAQ